jgi:hypothetical protein
LDGKAEHRSFVLEHALPWFFNLKLVKLFNESGLSKVNYDFFDAVSAEMV